MPANFGEGLYFREAIFESIMTAPADQAFKLTKLIKQGKATMNKEFKQLADWIDQTYGVKTMNIIYDTIKGKRPV